MVFKFIRKAGVWNMKLSTRLFLKKGVFPILDHYYEPLFNPKHLRKPLNEDRDLPGIDFNIKEQLDLLKKFYYNDELIKIPLEKRNDLEFYYHNNAFESGDAEFFYNIVRYFKPRKIIEIGSGNSTLLAVRAINENRKEDNNYICKHTCIEPYEFTWLEKMDVNLMRVKVECLDKNIFKDLGKNDILFIDSSHIIRPQGDVLFEYLEIIPILNSGVLVHIHDIFTPKDYLDVWVKEQMLMWNEQYLLEAFMVNNSEYKIIGALNFLKHHFPNELYEKCPILGNEQHREPGSFWIVRK